jgi:hypothetical protein
MAAKDIKSLHNFSITSSTRSFLKIWLLIAGDIFETKTLSNWAQNRYYIFLTRIQKTNYQHVVITAGSHHSASLLEAPTGILKTMNIHFVGSIGDEIDREINQEKNLYMVDSVNEYRQDPGIINSCWLPWGYPWNTPLAFFPPKLHG